MSRPRDPYFDFLKGIAIVMVVFIHTTPGLTVDSSSFADVSLLLFRQLINVAVPLFLVVSGYFCGLRECTEKGSHAFIYRQLRTLYVPCLLWSVPYLAIDLLHGNGIVPSLFMFFFCGYSVYYFILLIMQYYALSGKLKFISIQMGVLLTVLTVSLFTYYTHIVGIKIPLLFYAGIFPFWAMFFVFGQKAGMSHANSGHIFLWAIIALLGIILSLIETRWLYSFGHGGGIGVKLSSFIMSFGISGVLLTSSSKRYLSTQTWLIKPFSYLGRNSLGIYFVHCYIISALVLVDFNPGWGIKALLVLALSVLFIASIKKISLALSSYLGFR